MLERLKISGIRSFSSSSEITIDFDPRLTLILGHNGAGKTTIIEALKAVTTGLFPPNSDGGKSFIHDPKIAQKPEVQASMKLFFRTPQGKPIRIGRLISLVRKDSDKLELKKSENIVCTLDEEGKEAQNSLRVGDIDKLVPELIGLSSPILEYVTFCHQDESLWPFSDSSHLKRIFDQIFSTEAFSKALENHKKFIKKQSQDLQGKKNEMIWAQTLINQARQDREKMKSLKEEEIKLKEKGEELKNEILYVQNEKKAANRMQNLMSCKEAKINEKISLEKIVEGYGDIIISDNIEETENKINKLIEDKKSIEDSIKGLTVKIEKLEGDKGNILERVGSTKCKLDFYEEKIIKKAQLEEQMRSEIGEENPKSMLDIWKHNLNKMNYEFDISISKYNDELQRLKNELSMLEFEINSLSEVVRQQEIDLDEFRVKSSESNRSSLESSLKSLQISIQEMDKENQNSEKLIMILDKEFSDLEFSKQIGLEQNQSRIKALQKEADLARLKELIGKIVAENPSLESIYINSYQNMIKELYDVAHEKYIEKLTEVSILEEGIESANCSIEKLKANINELTKSTPSKSDLPLLLSSLGVQKAEFHEYQSILEKMKADTNHEFTYLKNFAAAKRYLIEEAIEKGSCPICDCDTHSCTDCLKQKLTELKNVESTEPENLIALESKIESIQKCLDLIQGFSKNYKLIEDTKESYNKVREELKIKMPQLEEARIQRNNWKERCSLLNNALENISKMYSIIESLEINSKVLYADIIAKNITVPEEVDISQVINEINAKSNEKKIFCENIRNLKKQIDISYTKISELNSQLISLSSIPNLISLEEEIINKRKQIEQKSSEIDPLKTKIKEAEEALQNEKSSKSSNQNAMNSKISRFESIYNSYLESCSYSSSYQDTLSQMKLLDNLLDNIQSELSISKEKHKNLSIAMQSTSKELLDLQVSFSKFNELKKQQEFKADLRKLEGEIVELDQKLSQFDGAMLKDLQERELDIKVEQGRIEGRLSSIQEELKELSKKPTSMSETKAAHLYIETRILEKSIGEHKSFIKCLDNAIIKYHQQKIDQINMILRTLWTETYKGRDIETIMIKTDPIQKDKGVSYNYRITLIGNNTELDMRGRCSAGQRMLASLIIRIALAQAFSSGNCIIALDEPTTNMDIDNTDGLGDAIASLVNGNPKLQMMIISHDQDFIRKVLRSTERSSYFVVEKLRGRSVVNKVSSS
ncbi:unnamed protein product [Blepharisma stoltei]|uniref:Rad50/SbcC-type AAA domain-containing protein n=1 Tax=Blepharisma stoltei TaxID=1481888 RepID=A0AAU9IJK1_9CILI|nr:unnamed protein product [Blepharisma stoltei]